MTSSLSNLNLTCLSVVLANLMTYMTIDVVKIVWIFPIICFSAAATQYPGEADDVDSKIRSFISLCHFPASKGDLPHTLYHRWSWCHFFHSTKRNVSSYTTLSKDPPSFILFTCRQMWKGAKRACTAKKIFHNMNVLQKASPLIAQKRSLTVDMVLGTRQGIFSDGW